MGEEKMIKANELRIGNWYKWPNFKGNVTGLFQLTEAIMVKILETPSALEQVDGISLTPAILEMCGFVEQELPANYAGGMNGYKICIRPSADRWLMLTGRSLMIGHINENNNIYKGASIGSYRLLHEVQNLYFALTGEELEVKL